MKILYFDCSMGAAGDMLTAALFELCPDKELFLEKINSCGIPGVSVNAERVVKCGIEGTHMSVLLDGKEEHCHEHHHHHEHHHEHMCVSEIDHIISHLHLPEKVKSDAKAVFMLLAKAESTVHGKAVDQIHFHEVGTMDAVADIVSVCLLMNEIQPQKVVASAVNVGGGTVKCAHGILPVPAPATAELLKGIPAYSGKIKSELCTPTGAALLKYFVNDFSDMPIMSVLNIGYGMGRKDFEVPNCIRAFFGESATEKTDEVAEISCNIDDMTGEEIGFAVQMLLDNGALDVWTAPIYMKKSRPAVMLSCLCKNEDSKKFAGLIFKYTSTIGVRVNVCSRYCLERSVYVKHTDLGDVRIKRSEGFGVVREKAEYEDLARIAEEKNISIGKVKELI